MSSIEPIKLEFLMKENVTESSEKASAAAEVLGRTAQGMALKLKEQIIQQRDAIRNTERQLKKLERQLSNAPIGKEYNDIARQVELLSQTLDEEKEKLKDLDLEHKKATESAKKLKTEKKALEEAMKAMKGTTMETSEEYKILATRAAELTDNFGDVTQQVNNLAHDDAGLQGLISALSGASGAMTATTGVIGIFISEEEELAKMQTRLQAVMSITMGLQQVMNALNADSAFRTIVVKRAKEMLTTANTRLATSLGISTAAAQALMATLTLGATVVIAAAIAAYNKYADAQEAARKKAQELLELEKNGRAETLRKRFELNRVTESIKKFNSSKEEEARRVKELNEKYGESFGYYKTLSEWYDVLMKKSEDYIDVLFREHKIRALMDKAVKKDEELAEAKAKSPSDYITFTDRIGSVMSGFTGQWIDSDEIGEERKKRETAILRAERQKILDEAKAEQDAIDEIRHKHNIGGNEDPEEVKRRKDEAHKKAEAHRKELKDGYKSIAATETALRRGAEDDRISAMEDEFERERKTVRTNYERKRQEIEQQETESLRLIKELRAKGHHISPAKEQELSAHKHEALVANAAAEAAELERIDERQRKKQQEELDELLDKYRGNSQQRIKIEEEYQKEIKHLKELRTDSNAAEVDDALIGAKRVRDEQMRAIDDRELQDAQKTSEFLVRLFEDAGEKTASEIKRIIQETEALVEYIRSTASEDLTSQHGISAETLRTIQQSPEELDRLTQAIKRQKGELSGRSPYEAFFLSLEKGIAALKKGGKEGVAQGMTTIAGTVQRVLPEVKELGSSLSAVFGDEVGGDIGVITDLLGGMGDTAMGVGRIMSGDVLGGIQGVMQGVSSILSMSAKANEAHRAALKVIAEAQREFERRYTLMLMKQRLLMEEAATPFGEDKVRKAANALQVLADAQDEYNRRLKGDEPKKRFFLFDFGLKEELAAYKRGVGVLQQAKIVTGREKTGLFGWGKGRDVYSSLLDVYPKLIKATGELDSAMLREIINTRKISDEHKRMLEGILESEELVKEANKQFDDYLTETFGSLGASMSSALAISLREGRDALEVFADDAAKTLERMGEQMAYSLFFADRFSKLQQQLKRVYQANGSPETIAHEVKNLLADFMQGSKTAVKQAQDMMKAFKSSAAESGFKIWGNDGVGQSGCAGAFMTMTQEQGTKLEGLFTSGQVHWASIDDQMGGITLGLSRQLDALSLIARHTAPIIEIYNHLQNISRDGIKIK